MHAGVSEQPLGDHCYCWLALVLWCMPSSQVTAGQMLDACAPVIPKWATQKALDWKMRRVIIGGCHRYQATVQSPATSHQNKPNDDHLPDGTLTLLECGLLHLLIHHFCRFVERQGT